MAMNIRYSGEFLSINGVKWRCEILQESDTVFNVGELDFPDAEPLTIEWFETAKEDAVCGSSAVLTITSPGDRTYIDLYSVKPGQIRLDVFREDRLYWSGCLDPEFYSEPYDRADNYDVSLTFSDFGIMDRIPYDLTGRRTLLDIVSRALECSAIEYGQLDVTMISTSFTDGTPMTLDSLSIPSENFIDEDGVATSYREAVEGILKPLGLRMIQSAGTVFIYDLNGLCTKNKGVRQIAWENSTSLGTDNVYNDIKVTFSPYASADVMKGELDYGDTYGTEWTNLTSDSSGVKYYSGSVPSGIQAPTCHSYYVDYDESHRHGNDWDYNLIDFTIFLSYDSQKCTGLAERGYYNPYFKILPVLGGSESEGVAGGFYTGGHGGLSTGWPKLKGVSPTQHNQSIAMKTARIYLPLMSANERKGNMLHILQEILFDPRYNPFTEEGEGNEAGNYETVKSYSQFCFVPIDIVMYDEDGNALCHYSNKWLTENGCPGNSVKATAEDTYGGKWGWKDGESSFGEAWLAYYDHEDLVSGSGVLGWKANRQSFGKPWTDSDDKEGERSYSYTDKTTGETKAFWLFDSFRKIQDGQFIPYPPKGGYLEIRIYNGIWAFDDTDRFSADAAGKFKDNKLYEKIRWQLYKLPRVTVVKTTLTQDAAEMDDVEYSGVLNVDAMEDLEINTICGTSNVSCPTARGIYVRTSDGLHLKELVRAGRTDHPEHLLIGTLYSQYADRRIILQGDAYFESDGLNLYTDPAQDANCRFMIKGETQNVKDDISEVKFVEVRPDEYIGKEN